MFHMEGVSSLILSAYINEGKIKRNTARPVDSDGKRTKTMSYDQELKEGAWMGT